MMRANPRKGTDGGNCQGFTMVEVIAAWMIFLILFLGTAKSFRMASNLGGEGKRMRNFTMEAYENAIREQKLYKETETDIKMEMNGETGSVQVSLKEYKASGDPVKKGKEPRAILRSITLR